MPNEFWITDALTEHVPDIAALEEICFSSPWPAEVLARSLTGKDHVLLAALDEDGLLGYMGLMYVLDEGYISNVAVAPQARRRGVGDGLVLAMRQRGRQLGLSFLSLEVRVSNGPARALYEKHGFREVGLRKNYYEKPVEDALLMTLFL